MTEGPSSSSAVDHPEAPPCPECHSQKTACTVKSAVGSYCRCEQCGYTWHQAHAAKTQ